jgi:hypothetical protein
MNDRDAGDDENHGPDDVVDMEAEGKLASEHAIATDGKDEIHNHRKPLWIGLGSCVFLVVLFAILIPTVFMDRGSDSNAQAIRGPDFGKVRC